jgi:hypothetical protein
MTMTDVVDELKQDAEMARILAAYSQWRDDYALMHAPKEAEQRAYLRCVCEYGRERVLSVIERMRQKRNAA